MKKTILTLALSAGLLAAYAQDMKPVAGDYSIGVTATPFLTYIGGFFSNAGAAAPSFVSAQGTTTINGKYFTADDRALRATFTLGLNSSSTEAVNVTDAKKRDIYKTSGTTIGVGLGYEFKRAKGERIVFSYGPQVAVSSSATTFFDPTAGTLVTGNAEFTNAADNSKNYKTEGGSALAVGLGGFAGVEYFFTPFVSLSGEFNLNLGITSTSERTVKVGTTDPTVVTSKASTFGINTVGGSFGNIVLNFYF